MVEVRKFADFFELQKTVECLRYYIGMAYVDFFETPFSKIVTFILGKSNFGISK